ncbi:MAG: Gam protein [Thermoclostridium sp.]|nr:Gam protein [Thermoclostridium sp.]
MKKNHFGIIISVLIIVALVISNLYFLKKTMDLNKQLGRLYELEALISSMQIEHQAEMDQLMKDQEEKLSSLTNEYTNKFETVKKSLNAFEYELEEFYKNKHILKEDYLENLQKIREIQKALDEGD